jgi:hypothetical protein
MRIEMVGPPASGKSSVVRALIALGIERGPRGDPERIPKQWYQFKKFILNAYKGTSHEHTRLPIKSLEGLAAAWVGDNSSIPMVFDEHVILNGFSMETRYPGTGKKYFEMCPLPDILVSLWADDNIFFKRNRKREWRKGRNRYEKSIRFKLAIDEYLPLLKSRGCNIMEFDSGKIRKSKIAKSVYREIKRLQNEGKK